jgi:hypothetical protein
LARTAGAADAAGAAPPPAMGARRLQGYRGRAGGLCARCVERLRSSFGERGSGAAVDEGLLKARAPKPCRVSPAASRAPTPRPFVAPPSQLPASAPAPPRPARNRGRGRRKTKLFHSLRPRRHGGRRGGHAAQGHGADGRQEAPAGGHEAGERRAGPAGGLVHRVCGDGHHAGAAAGPAAPRLPPSIAGAGCPPPGRPGRARRAARGPPPPPLVRARTPPPPRSLDFMRPPN